MVSLTHLHCWLGLCLLAASSWVANLRADAVDDYVRGELEQHRIAGLSLAIVRDGNVEKLSAYGTANLELNAPVTTNTVFEIGSLTKQFTAAAILLLVEDGKLGLDDPLSRHLADLPEAWDGITIRHLLTHTSGLRNYTGLPGFEVTRRLTAGQFVTELARQPLQFAPGERWSYCNSGYNLLGFIIERSSGQAYAEFLNERLFKPLGMTSSRTRDVAAIIPNRANGYELKRGLRINRDSDLTDVCAAGALVSTVPDLLKWNAALETEKTLSAASKRAMWTAVRLNDNQTHAYGLGWFLDPLSGHQNIGHSGSTSGFSASLQRFPADRLAIIILCNSGENGVATKLAKALAGRYFSTPAR